MEEIKKISKNEIIDRILDSYFASDQIYPDKYTLIYFTNARALNDKAFSDYCAGSEERRLKYEAYLNTLEERKKLFTTSKTVIFSTYWQIGFLNK